MTLAVECVPKEFSGSARRSDKTRESGGEVTLEDLIVGVWEDLAAHYETLCPVCGGRMTVSGTETCALGEAGHNALLSGDDALLGGDDALPHSDDALPHSDEALPTGDNSGLSASCLSCGSLLE